MLQIQKTVTYKGATYHIVEALWTGYWVVTKEDPKQAEFPLQVFIIPQEFEGQ